MEIFIRELKEGKKILRKSYVREWKLQGRKRKLEERGSKL